MLHRKYKYALPDLIPIPGTPRSTPFHPLTTAQLERARTAAEARFAASGVPTEGADFEIEVMLQTLARSSRARPETLRGTLDVSSLGELFLAWQRLQAPSTEEDSRLREWLRKRVHDSQEIHDDGAAAFVAEVDPASFYGRPLVDLTRGQVLYYWLVRGAFAEWFGPGVTKKPTLTWLKSD